MNKILKMMLNFYGTILSPNITNEPPHDKTNIMTCAPSEDSDLPVHPPSLIRVFVCAQWVANDPSFLHVDSEDSDQTGRMLRLIWVFAGLTCHLVGFVMRQLKCLYEHRIAVIKLKVERYGLL